MRAIKRVIEFIKKFLGWGRDPDPSGGFALALKLGLQLVAFPILVLFLTGACISAYETAVFLTGHLKYFYLSDIRIAKSFFLHNFINDYPDIVEKMITESLKEQPTRLISVVDPTTNASKTQLSPNKFANTYNLFMMRAVFLAVALGGSAITIGVVVFIKLT